MHDIKKFWLEKFDCFTVGGKDARKFFNGITTSNILNSENLVYLYIFQILYLLLYRK